MQIPAIELREDIYQAYHPFILNKLSPNTAGVGLNPSITLDGERAKFLFGEKGFAGQRLLDIGVNQGYLSVEARPCEGQKG